MNLMVVFYSCVVGCIVAALCVCFMPLLRAFGLVPRERKQAPKHCAAVREQNTRRPA